MPRLLALVAIPILTLAIGVSSALALCNLKPSSCYRGVNCGCYASCTFDTTIGAYINCMDGGNLNCSFGSEFQYCDMNNNDLNHICCACIAYSDIDTNGNCVGYLATIYNYTANQCPGSSACTY